MIIEVKFSGKRSAPARTTVKVVEFKVHDDVNNVLPVEDLGSSSEGEKEKDDDWDDEDDKEVGNGKVWGGETTGRMIMFASDEEGMGSCGGEGHNYMLQVREGEEEMTIDIRGTRTNQVYKL